MAPISTSAPWPKKAPLPKPAFEEAVGAAHGLSCGDTGGEKEEERRSGGGESVRVASGDVSAVGGD